MNTLLLLNLGNGEIVVILVVVLLLFGARRIPELARGLGRGIREFKDASTNVRSEIERAQDEPVTPRESEPTGSKPVA